VFVVAIAGGDARAVTTAKTSVRDLAWLPDGKSIGYLADREPTGDHDLDSVLREIDVRSAVELAKREMRAARR